MNWETTKPDGWWFYEEGKLGGKLCGQESVISLRLSGSLNKSLYVKRGLVSI